MSDEAKIKSTQNLGPVAADLHRALKRLALDRDISLRQLLEDNLGPVVGWAPANESGAASELSASAQ